MITKQIAYLKNDDGTWVEEHDVNKILDHHGRIIMVDWPTHRPGESAKDFLDRQSQAIGEIEEKIALEEGRKIYQGYYHGFRRYTPTDVPIHNSINKAIENLDEGPQFVFGDISSYIFNASSEIDGQRYFVCANEHYKSGHKHLVLRHKKETDPSTPFEGYWVERNPDLYQKCLEEFELKEKRFHDNIQKNGYKIITANLIKNVAHQCAKEIGICRAKAVTIETSLVWILAHDAIKGKKLTNKMLLPIARTWNKDPKKWKGHFSRWTCDKVIEELDARMATVTRRRIHRKKKTGTKGKVELKSKEQLCTV